MLYFKLSLESLLFFFFFLRLDLFPAYFYPTGNQKKSKSHFTFWPLFTRITGQYSAAALNRDQGSTLLGGHQPSQFPFVLWELTLSKSTFWSNPSPTRSSCPSHPSNLLLPFLPSLYCVSHPTEQRHSWNSLDRTSLSYKLKGQSHSDPHPTPPSWYTTIPTRSGSQTK